ncbi:PorP/SprF family type IX secretion system membrane protein [Chitinophaga nivalis]|uniref:PorP/SprF family type IX secretion system membrane protein n=1 Tax=Chitinophaga nivalis TaxID=2991709 RepID=A0ABT3IVI0_9BACT|nr:PorP/SprF family type IX secretion system membrane protein [Chitinophaga nivalis]MCW3462620.1 PorP/SprF family type IX secretion system membrane protein [Chitinophaga nivalis]MCW3487689.1 PorP/SprF family type IX secretion system membrane protein [Chitinophaga nivalis]
MKRIFIIAILLGSSLLPRMSFAQVDPHFSQYYAYPLWLNPALTGVIDGDYRISGNYRNQWANYGKPFSTAGVSLDAATDKNIGVGLNVLNMSAGDAGYNYFNAMASVSYSGVKFGRTKTSQLVFGIQAGLINRRVDPAKFQTGSQYQPVIGYDPSIASGENVNTTSSTAFDAGAGAVFFDGNPNHTLNPFIGFSAAHLTQPKDPFSADGIERKLPIRYLVHGGSRIKLNESLSLTPTGLYLHQGNAHEIVVGMYAKLLVNPEFDLLLGSNYRFNDAVIPFAGFHFKSFVLGLSYDASTSNMRRLVNGSQSFEISLSFISRKRRVLNEEYFICPRL